MKEYEGETPLKEMAVVEALARWPEEVVAIGAVSYTHLDVYKRQGGTGASSQHQDQ